MNTELNNDNLTSPPAPVYLNFKNLPPPVKKRLLVRLKGAGEGFAIKTAGISSSYFITAAAIAWFVLLFYLSNDFLWGNVRIAFFASVSLLAAYLLLYHLSKLFRWFTSAQKSYLLITPLYVIDIFFNDIRYWNLEQLNNVASANSEQEDGDPKTQVTLALENGSRTFPVKDRQTAEEMVEQINYWRKLFIEATVRNDSTYLDAHDDFKELENRENKEIKTARRSYWQPILTFAAAAMVTAGVMFGVILLNTDFDDRKSWDLAQTVNRASSYRNYLQGHPQGRFRSDAQAKLQTLYNEAEQKYEASLNKDFDPKAADAVLQVLRYAKQTQNYRVKVNFERRNEIPPDIVEKLKEEYEVKHIIEIGDSFSDEKMQQREGNLLTVIADAFRQVIPDDILEITGDCSAECVTFLVKYKIRSDSIYYDTLQKDVPENDRVYKPGIFFDWDFGVQIPNQPQIYSFTLESDPAADIFYDRNPNLDYTKGDFVETAKADRENVYNSMVTSAFDNFKENLILKTGIGTAPENAEESAPNFKSSPLTDKEKSKVKK
jgi:hypothetical protein